MHPLTVDDIEADIRAAITDGDADRLDRLAAAMDTAQQRENKPLPCLGNAALWYAQHGLCVFPLKPGSKQPATRHGCHDATTEPAQIRRWWTARPEANIGLATGHVIDVIDIDGRAGMVSYARELLDDNHGWDGPPILGRVSTPRPGGHHIYVTADPERRNRANLLPGIDTRATGGYVVAPPSRTRDGAYRWTLPLDLAEHRTMTSELRDTLDAA